jgi:hypothetical protein
MLSSDVTSWTKWAFERQRSKTPIPAVKEDKMFNKARLPWTSDPLNLTFIAVVIAACIAMYFIIERGWSW